MTNIYQIGVVAENLGISIDTLRYYEKIKLLPKINRSSSGVRLYSDKDLSRLKFIKRAQRMNFSLAEIADLLDMRENPLKARKKARELTQRKLIDIEEHLRDLSALRNELQLLVNLCTGSENGCPIIEGIDAASRTKANKQR